MVKHRKHNLPIMSHCNSWLFNWKLHYHNLRDYSLRDYTPRDYKSIILLDKLIIICHWLNKSFWFIYTFIYTYTFIYWKIFLKCRPKYSSIEMWYDTLIQCSRLEFLVLPKNSKSYLEQSFWPLEQSLLRSSWNILHDTCDLSIIQR